MFRAPSYSSRQGASRRVKHIHGEFKWPGPCLTSSQGHVRSHVDQSRSCCILSMRRYKTGFRRGLFLPPMTYNGGSRNWPDPRSPIRNPRYANCRHLSPYTIIRVSKCSVINCGSGAATNMQKSALTSLGHTKLPSDLSLNGRRSPFTHNSQN